MGKKGIRSQKGQSESDWGQPKTKRLTVQLTEEGYESVKKRAERFGISVTEAFERWGRGVSLDTEPEEPAPTGTRLPTVDSILAMLPRYSRQQVLRIVKAGLDLLIGGSTPEPEPMTVEEEINASDPQEFGVRAGIPPERIADIQKGGDVYYDELIKLARVFKMKPSELRDQIPNKVANGCNT